MTRYHAVAAAVLVALGLVAGGWLVAGVLDADDAGVEIGGADESGDFEHDYLIEDGTAARIAAGEPLEIVPAELVVRVGESIRIVNEDTEDHLVGAFFVAAGETLTQEFRSAGVLEGACTVHPSGSFTLRVVE